MPDTSFVWSATLVNAANPTGPANTYNESSFAGRAYNRDEPGTGFGPAMADMCKTLEYTAKASSTSSHSAVLGSKVFGNLVGGFGFYPGMAVRVVKSTTDWMEGLITAVDLVAQTCTINITSVTSAFGAHNAWTIGLGSATINMASSPASIAQGGTGSGTAGGARTNLELGRYFPNITSIVSTPPGSPADQQRHIVGISPTGAFVGHEHQVATFTTGVGWAFITPTASDAAYNIATTDSLLYTGAAQNFDGVYPGSYWRPLTPTRSKWKDGPGIFANYSVVAADHGFANLVQTSGTNITITLPLVAAAEINMEVAFFIPDTNGNSVTFVRAGGGNLYLANDTYAASVVVSAGSRKVIHFCAGSVNLPTWTVWR